MEPDFKAKPDGVDLSEREPRTELFESILSRRASEPNRSDLSDPLLYRQKENIDGRYFARNKFGSELMGRSVVAALLYVSAMAFLRFSQTPHLNAWYVFHLAVLCLPAGALVAWVWFQRRQWVQVLPGGLIWSRYGRRRILRWNDLIFIAPKVPRQFCGLALGLYKVDGVVFQIGVSSIAHGRVFILNEFFENSFGLYSALCREVPTVEEFHQAMERLKAEYAEKAAPKDLSSDPAASSELGRTRGSE